MNGDHKADVVAFGKWGTYVSLSAGTSFGPSALWRAAFGTAQGWTSQNTYPRWAADVTGDGRADVVGFGAAGTFVSLAQ